MTVELTDPRVGRAGVRCVIGRHAVDGHNYILFSLDGKLMCKDHILELMGAVDTFYDRANIGDNQVMRAHRERDVERAEAKLAESMRRTARTREPGFIYYLMVGEHIKIGYAIDVKKRMRAYPPGSTLLAVHPGTREVEKRMHEQFGAHLDRGREWFKQGKSLMAHIDETRAQFGEPTLFAHKFTEHKKQPGARVRSKVRRSF